GAWLHPLRQCAQQAIRSAIVHSGDRAANDPDHVRRALQMAVRGGGDTDTVAAIAGGLIGAAYGVSAIPLGWKRRIHGWPGWRSEELVEHAVTAQRISPETRAAEIRGGPALDPRYSSGWRTTQPCARHPHA
ncbi:ADP-ribosylglycohydrolase family protein, partial [Mycobacterium tuberculosis]|nr:ADP-ribosylglycohydrolase family protein [Mycobacterium tuberculosis]